MFPRVFSALHDQWITDYNHQVHWAHRFRDDGRESPAEVLDWVYGHVWDEAALHYAFYATRFGRRLDKAGYVHFRHYRLYAEPGLERRRVAVWLYKEQLTVGSLISESVPKIRPTGGGKWLQIVAAAPTGGQFFGNTLHKNGSSYGKWGDSS